VDVPSEAFQYQKKISKLISELKTNANNLLNPYGQNLATPFFFLCFKTDNFLIELLKKKNICPIREATPL